MYDTGLIEPDIMGTVVNTDVYHGFAGGLAQGTSYTQRIGNQVTWKSIQLNLTMQAHPAGAAAYINNGVYAKVLVIMDRSPTGAVPDPNQVIEDWTTNTYNIIRPLNLANRQRFTTIWDKVFKFGTISYNATSGLYAFSAPLTQHMSKYKRLNIKSTYGGTTDAITDIKSNAFYIYIFTNLSATIATNTVGLKVRYWLRMRFTDV